MIRVLLVDDQALVRSGFRIILESEPDIEVIGEAANGGEAVELTAELHPDVICMDVEMPEMNGIEASRRILGDPSAEGPAVLILTTFGHEAYLFDALAAGVSGFLLKTSRAEQLIDAVRTLASGQALLGSDVTRAVIDRISARAPGPGGAGRPGEPGSAGPADRGSASDEGRRATAGATVDAAAAQAPAQTQAPPEAAAALDRAGLTEREREVLSLMAEGRSNAEIASELFLGEATIKTHVSNVLQKLGVRDRIQAVVWAHTRGVAQSRDIV
ncbi:response regulator transcription factor [Leucobacter muris]|uniref:Response regulator transcription factor n=1 Tax=Leucobacter muris TaxID=1935379 RepID=A0ABX5QII9_9MICO|nr:response regulator transcription factor [Leucobacter muris]QAB18922.1 response regulator transcription factor [Leucobacter muris]